LNEVVVHHGETETAEAKQWSAGSFNILSCAAGFNENIFLFGGGIAGFAFLVQN
jgi:hypothetical protein